MIPGQTVTDDIFAAFLKCRYKAYLKLLAATGEPSDHQQLQTRRRAEYRVVARHELIRNCEPGSVVIGPATLADAIQRDPVLILDAPMVDGDRSCRLDALERRARGAYSPVLFFPTHRVSAEERMQLAFGADVLTRVCGVQPEHGRIVHGPNFQRTRVRLPTLDGPVRDSLNGIRAIRDAAIPPPLILNRHCPECEYRRSCQARAIEKDDLSLLRGLSANEIAGLNNRGVFTVQQLSHTFRPGRLKRAKQEGAKRDYALQALAIRDKKIYVAFCPRLPEGKVMAYLDVEGIPDRDHYYLIGLTVRDGKNVHHSSFWADREADEPNIWNEFLSAVRSLEDEFVLHHYGSYETQFLERMQARYGGDPGILARLKSRSVNVLTAIHAGVYFPTHANDLKSLAGCLGFRWSSADGSGLQSIVWRYIWEEICDPAAKGQLLTYNREDCAALELVTAAVRSLGADSPPALAAGMPVAGINDIKNLTHRKYGNSPFALPVFAEMVKCAYFDYQRDKILCRTSPSVKKSLRRKRRPRRQSLRVNQIIECEDVRICPDCGSTTLDISSRYQRCIVDLKVFRGGVKRWVTRYRVIRRRCRRCLKTFFPQQYLALPSKYGRGFYSWIVYASIALRQTNDAVMDSLNDLFGIPISSAMVSRIRQYVVDYYRATSEMLLGDLRKGALVHADETRVSLKCPTVNGYVWAFASPDTAVYLYAPTRDGSTVRDALAGFKGVLVSDFYSAYDSIECQQQKCLVHLIRDLNDDLLKSPFDEDLKQLAARFTAVLQPVIHTIDRFGLKKFHLGKHKPEVERFFAATSDSEFVSKTAKHYRSRFLKYRDKLFAFLDYDGVPWNNNNAENAVKLFASRRKVLSTPFTDRGIKDYLLLLSLYQTLRYRGLGFWQFLLSGETDIAAYTASSR